MRQQDFERKNEHLWREVEALVMKEAARVSQKNAVASGSAEGGADLVDLPDLYSQLCHQLALAKHRRYSSGLVNKLNDLCVQTHHYLYRQNRRHEFLFIEFCLHRFPAALHKNARFVWVALASFLIPALLMGVLCFINEDMIFSLLSPADVYSFESMYEPGNHAIGRERGSQTDLMMFGFYIKNNIGISFRTFAGGVLLGLGSLFFLVYNGLFLGAAAGHITSIGYQETFFPFVVGHGAFELTAIVFSGAAGLMLGYALINPGVYSRMTALKLAGREAATIVLGAALMLLVAAFLEAFWSSRADVVPAIKYSAGAVFWAVVIGYCVLLGKAANSEP